MGQADLGITLRMNFSLLVEAEGAEAPLPAAARGGRTVVARERGVMVRRHDGVWRAVGRAAAWLLLVRAAGTTICVVALLRVAEGRGGRGEGFSDEPRWQEPLASGASARGVRSVCVV